MDLTQKRTKSSLFSSVLLSLLCDMFSDTRISTSEKNFLANGSMSSTFMTRGCAFLSAAYGEYDSTSGAVSANRVGARA